MGEQTRPRRRLVLFPCPLQGHITPMLQLATILHNQSKGALSIIVVHTHFNSPNPANYPDFTFLPISDGLPPAQTNISAQDVIPWFFQLNDKCAPSLRDCVVNKILSQQDEPPVACIISDATMYFTQSVADSLHIPRLVLRTSSALNLVVFAAFPLLRDKGYLPIKESELDAPVRELPPIKVKDLPMIKSEKFDSIYLFITNMVNQTNASSGLILNSCESLEQSALETLRKEFQRPIFPIGPFHISATDSSGSLLEEDYSCLSWLNKQSPSSVIYISFGSIAAIDETQLVEIALGVVNSEQPFLWVIRPGLVKRSSTSDVGDDLAELLPQEFNEMMETHTGRGCIVKWAPQKEVLAHPAVGGFCTHNGWNSTLESICEGVPMLSWPCFGDQQVNARCVSDVWRVGFLLENGMKRGEIERFIRRLMTKENNTEMEQMMATVNDLKVKARRSLKKGGSTYKSLEGLTEYIFSMGHSN